MNTLEVYQHYLALGRHFTSSYNYHKYNGKVKVTADALRKRNDQKMFSKIAHYRDPEEFLIGNFLYNKSTWIGDFNEEARSQFVLEKTNALRQFTTVCLPKLSPIFNENFVVDSTHSIPYTIKLHNAGQITLSDCCALESLMDCDERWKAKPQYIVFGQKSKFIRKAAPFFDFNIDKYHAALVQYFNVSND